MAIMCRASLKHPEMPQIILLLKMPFDSSSQPFMTPCARQVMNRIPGDVTPPWDGCWGPPRSYSMSRAIYSPAQRNRRTARPSPQTKTPYSTQKSEPQREKGPLTCSPYKQSGGSSRSSPPGPAFSLQREHLTVVAQGGPLGGSWSQMRHHGVNWGGHVHPTFVRWRSWDWCRSGEFVFLGRGLIRFGAWFASLH